MPMGRPSKRGDKHFDSTNGYWLVCVKRHPLFPNRTWVAEHRVLMAEKLGRPLSKGELVHHKDEIKTHNDGDNFELKTRSSHAALHGRGRKHTAETRAKMSKSAAIRNADPVFNKMLRERAKAQHAAGKLGAQTWKTRTRPRALYVPGRGS